MGFHINKFETAEQIKQKGYQFSQDATASRSIVLILDVLEGTTVTRVGLYMPTMVRLYVEQGWEPSDRLVRWITEGELVGTFVASFRSSELRLHPNSDELQTSDFSKVGFLTPELNPEMPRPMVEGLEVFLQKLDEYITLANQNYNSGKVFLPKPNLYASEKTIQETKFGMPIDYKNMQWVDHYDQIQPIIFDPEFGDDTAFQNLLHWNFGSNEKYYYDSWMYERNVEPSSKTDTSTPYAILVKWVVLADSLEELEELKKKALGAHTM